MELVNKLKHLHIIVIWIQQSMLLNLILKMKMILKTMKNPMNMMTMKVLIMERALNPKENLTSKWKGKLKRAVWKKEEPALIINRI